MTAPSPSEVPFPSDAYSLEAVITALFEGLLGRPPDGEGLRHHVEIVRASGLAHVVKGIAGSAEALAQLGMPARVEQAGGVDQAGGVQEEEARPEPKDELVEAYLEAWD